ncbi:acetyl/propionyl/methylcrotonyl-CoA carboxylase subunit alpha [Metallibacterium scheffleri]|uniref:acetyl/propionyl/methylcrotonyl-CoA carboxylase subunit alpha n=1 Tax=Metallibacterium scheffleri TaxID=993689 RepID=UPI0023F181EF|nr:biotin carboxylase N-terminal domain-containing protein [Metallibacterium scheffleri]
MSFPIDSVLIANRGEIACRIIRTLRRLGLRSIAVYSEADADAQHVRLADMAVPIGGPRPQDSYLRGDAIIAAAQACGAQAIHPGYGFLSENADFAEAVAQAGLSYIGPSAASTRRMGSKAGAKTLMAAHGVPVVPGYTGADQDAALLAREAGRIGYPLMIKAAYGGGGKGMRIVRSADEFAAALASCQREAQGAFGNARVLVERYIEHPRHIEFQIFGDNHGHVIHLNERECSAQRRYQKVMEETPSPFLTPELRARMGAAAIAAGKALDYCNAGTVEFIVDPQGGFYFMELNARLQVEHPITEWTLGLDLVELQLRVAAGEPLPGALLDGAPAQNGHAIELRLYAEDPAQGFLPGSGRIEHLALPAPSPRVRVDSGVIEGDTVSIFYDPMIAKIIVRDKDRPRALARMAEALAACHVQGPKSNVAFLERLIAHPAVREGRIDTGYLDRALDEFLPVAAQFDATAVLAAAVAVLLHAEATALADHSPWATPDAWRMQGAAPRELYLQQGETRLRILATGHHGDYTLHIQGHAAAFVVAGARHDGDVLSLRLDDRALRLRVHRAGYTLEVQRDGTRHAFALAPAYVDATSSTNNDDAVRAPMPGRVVLVQASVGSAVEAGAVLLVMEAMKMELSLRAPRAGMVVAIQAAAGEFVEADSVLIRLD